MGDHMQQPLAPFQLNGKVALITRAASGLGKATAWLRVIEGGEAACMSTLYDSLS